MSHSPKQSPEVLSRKLSFISDSEMSTPSHIENMKPRKILEAPRISFSGPLLGEPRRSSATLVDINSEVSDRSASPRSLQSKTTKRLSSPPPPSTYDKRISFDSFANRDATDYSFTLKSKHRNYEYTPRSRTFLCGTDQNDYSEFALEWLIDELVEDGDEIVCLRVVDKDSKINSDASVEQGRYKTEANALLNHIKSKNRDDEKSISLILEFAVGKVQETIQRMIDIYEPACLIVGTRGRSPGSIQGLLSGSVSKYCLQNSPVPVIVVRPSAKREKKKQKRLADPKRKTYVNVLEQSGIIGSQNLTGNDRSKVVEADGEAASEAEAHAVARAIGLAGAHRGSDVLRRVSFAFDPDAEGAPLTRTASSRSEWALEPESPRFGGPKAAEPIVPQKTCKLESDDHEDLTMSEDEVDGEGEEEEEDDEEERAKVEEARRRYLNIATDELAGKKLKRGRSQSEGG